MDTLITLHPRKWRYFGFLFFVAVLLLLASTGNAAAQGTTPPTDTTGGSVVMNVWQILVFAVTFFLSGGAAGVVGFGALANRMRNDKATMTAIEHLAASWPAATRELLGNVGKSSIAVGELLTEATDDVPAADKPAPQ